MNGNGTVDPFLGLTGQVNSVKEDIADALGKEYRATIAHTANVNELAFQTFIWRNNLLANVKAELVIADHATELAQAHTAAAEAFAHGQEQVTALEQADSQSDLINILNAQNLNTAIINTTTTLVSSAGLNEGLVGAVAGAVASTQIATTVSAVNATNSATASQGMVNTGSMECVQQSATPTSIGG